MTRRTGKIVLVAALLLGGEAPLYGEAWAQPSGLPNLLGNIFSGKPAGATAQAQAAPTTSSTPLPWTGKTAPPAIR